MEGIDVPEDNGGIAGGIDLTSYELKNKQLRHFCLAVDKTLRLKRRKLRGFLCELLMPPLFICCLTIGHFASDNTYVESRGYAEEPYVNLTESIAETFCTLNFPSEVERVASAVPNCTHAPWWMPQFTCLYSIWNSPDGSTSLCVRPDTPTGMDKKGLKRLYYHLVRTADRGSTVPHFDTMVVLQWLAHRAKGNLRFNVDTYWNSLMHSGNIEIASADCRAGQELVHHFKTTTKFFGYIFNESLPRDGECANVWATEAAAVNYIRKDGAAKVWALIVLNDINHKTKVFDYTIRMNYTSTPYTKITHDKFAQGLGRNRSRQYINSGFPTLQTHIDSFYLGRPDLLLKTPVALPMPTGNYLHSQFLERAGTLIPLVFALAFLYPVSCLVGGIVEEKEHRLREGMLIMGLSKMSFYLAWFASYFLLLAVSSILVTAVACATFLSNTSPLLVFLQTQVYSTSIIALSLLMSVFFSKSRIAAIVSPLVVFALTVPKFTINTHADLSTHTLASLSSAVAYGYSTELIINYEKRGSGSDFTDFVSDSYSYGTALGMMLLDTILYLLLAWYLDSVLPSQYGVKLHPLFFLYPSYWGLTKTGKYGRQADNHDLTPPSRLPHYVDTEIDESTRQDLEERERVRIMGMRMEFASPDGKGPKNVAVNNLGNGVPSGAAGGADALTFYEGQVQCVLGHNGAGKTTLINMLTGMLTPTSGDCLIWGRSVRHELGKIRENIGLCPQHNILWARLSCHEHLMFYGRIKGVPEAVLRERVEQMLRLVNLYEKRDAWSEVLSGGQKRKLSVACALIGGSQLVFLDEPTAGMDVESRRAMWSLLRNPAVLRGRVIVLTTHYMEEADLLGDSVAIMHKGCLHSWGSSFYLKSRLGVGYNMSVAMRAQCVPEQVEEVVRRYITRAEVGRLSCTGNELRLRLPMDSLPDDEWLSVARNKMRLENTTDPAKMREAATAVIHERLASPEVLADCEALLSHIRTVSHFPDMFDELERRKDELHVESFGVGVTTLEEVFMRIALEEGDDVASGAGPHAATPALVDDSDSDADELTAMNPLSPQEHSHLEPSPTFGDLYTITDQDDPPIRGTQLYLEQFKGLFIKRVRCATRDVRTITFQFVLPVLFILLALLLGMVGMPTMPSIDLKPSMFGRETYMPYSVDVEEPESLLFTEEFMPGYHLVDVTEGGSHPAGYKELSSYLLQTVDHRRRDVMRDLALSYMRVGNETDFPVVFDNATFIHALPVGLNTIHNAVLRGKYDKTGMRPQLVTRNHPLPFSEYSDRIISEVLITITGIFIMIPFTFIPSNFVSFVVKERECKAKHVQVVSGAHLAAYWLSSFLFDLLSYLVTVAMAFVVFYAADRTEFIGSAEAFWASFLLFFEYGVSAILSSYFFSFLFSSHTSAQNAVMAFNFVVGFILVIVTQVLDYVKNTKHINPKLKFIYRLFPSYCLGEGIIRMSVRELAETVHYGKLSSRPFDLDTAGYPLIYMAAMTPVFLLLTLVVESPVVRLRFQRYSRAVRDKVLSLPADVARLCLGKGHTAFDMDLHLDMDSEDGVPLVDSSAQNHSSFDSDMYSTLPRDGPEVMYRRGAWLMCKSGDGSVYYFNEATGESKLNDKDTPFYRDQDVQRHAEEVLATENGRDGDYVTVKQLRKVWAPRGNAQKKVAVADLSFGVKSGELFAFLGTNGAGKTTTLSILSGEFEPTSGQAFIAGHDVVEDGQLARQNLGFCPQFDALLDHLTCEEHLELFACLRGIPKRHRKPSAEVLLNGLGLAPHRKKLASNLSGGNRRKLSVAVALMGGPSAVFLDEPSAGMDPLARRSLWGALEKAITDLKLSVILTTHHLEEIEGLGRLDHRVTIMVDGRLQCLGSLGQLKHQLGDAFELTLKVKSVDAEAALRAFLKEQWPKCELSESTQQRLSYQVAKEEASLSQMFRLIEDNRDRLGITDYSINETSLEQVFMRIGERAMREEDVLAYAATEDTVLPPTSPRGAPDV